MEEIKILSRKNNLLLIRSKVKDSPIEKLFYEKYSPGISKIDPSMWN